MTLWTHLNYFKYACTLKLKIYNYHLAFVSIYFWKIRKIEFVLICLHFFLHCTKMKFSITDFFSKCDQIYSRNPKLVHQPPQILKIEKLKTIRKLKLFMLHKSNRFWRIHHGVMITWYDVIFSKLTRNCPIVVHISLWLKFNLLQSKSYESLFLIRI